MSADNRGNWRAGHISGRRPKVTDLPPEQDVEQEIEVHLAQLMEELMGEGLSAEEARQEAMRRFGDREAIVSACRHETSRRDWRLWAADLIQALSLDVRFGLRQLVRNPGITLIIILTVAIGIGPNVALFSAMKALIIDPFPYPDADRLVEVWSTEIGNRWGNPASMPDYADVQEQNTTFEEIGLYTTLSVNFSAERADLIGGIGCTASLLEVFGVQPAHGRRFTEEEEIPGRDRVIILCDGLWRRRFEADPDILGSTVRVNGEGYKVIGIMPPQFEILSPWYRGADLEVMIPIQVDRDESQRDSHSWLIAGRLRPGIQVAAAEADVQAIAARLAEFYPGSNARDTFWLQPFSVMTARGGLGQLIIFLFISGLVLLAACTNVAGILLARGAGRRTEVAIRSSLGASRRRITSQLLVESLMMSLLAGGAGILLAVWSRDLLIELLPYTMQRTVGIDLDPGVLLFALGLSLLTGLVFGLIPARTASHTEVVSVFKEGSSGSPGRLHNRTLRRLTIAQLAIAIMLTNGALFLIQSQSNLTRIPLTFDTGEILTAEVWLNGARYGPERARIAFCDQLITRLEEHPRVEQAAVTSKLPMQGGTACTILVDDEVYEPDARRPHIERSYVTREFFRTMGIAVLAGRGLEEQDGNLIDQQRRTVVVNRALADHYWPDGNAVGRVIRYNGDPSRWSAVIVGVVESTRQWGPQYLPSAEIYFPFSIDPWNRIRVAVRAHGNPLALVPAVREIVAGLDPDLALSAVRTMADLTEERNRDLNVIGLLVKLFGGITIFLALAGVYGIMSHVVAQRLKEFGVRGALGAERTDLMKLVIGRAFRLVVIGAIFGMMASVIGGFTFRPLIFGLDLFHWLYLLAGAGMVALLALLTSGLPAWRASRVDPIEALRD